MGFIYCIKNDVNDKVYIGQTINTIEHRFGQHLRAAKLGLGSKLYEAIREIGKEHFYVEEICSCSQEELNDNEIKYIQKFDSFRHGYNLTSGGCKREHSNEEITDELEETIIGLYTEYGMSYPDIQEILGASNYVARFILETNLIDTDKSFQGMMQKVKHKIYGVQRKCGHIVSFDSEYLAAQEMYDEGMSKQYKLYIKNDILRSIGYGGESYGIGGYTWFENECDAVNKSNRIKKQFNADRYDIIQRGKFVEVKAKKHEIKPYSERNLNYLGIDLHKNIPEDFDPHRKYGRDKEKIGLLLKEYSVNKIAEYYGVSFTSMKRRIKAMGFPYTKYELEKYRKQI